MKTVYKYLLPPANFNVVMPYTFPAEAAFLSVGEQDQELMLWAKVDPTAPSQVRKLVVVGTGFPLPEEPGHVLDFIATVQMRSGIVLHVFELLPPL